MNDDYERARQILLDHEIENYYYAKIKQMLLNDHVDDVVAEGTAVVSVLIAALRDGEWAVRWRAAVALGRIGDVRAVPALVDVLKARSYFAEAWEDAARALGEIAKKHPDYDWGSVTPVLIECLKDGKGRMRRNAAQALADIAEKAGMDLRAVERALKEYVDKAGEKGDSIASRNAMNEATEQYLRICNAVRGRLEKAHPGMDGVILVGERPRPPSREKMYRISERRAAKL